MVGFNLRDEVGSGEIAFWLGPAGRGRGLMTTAARPATASSTSDFPAPVSPVMALRPGPGRHVMASMMPKPLTVSSSSTGGPSVFFREIEWHQKATFFVNNTLNTGGASGFFRRGRGAGRPAVFFARTAGFRFLVEAVDAFRFFIFFASSE